MDKQINILLVEDSEADAFIASHMLKNVYTACEITRVYNGKQALEYMLNTENTKPDLILTDLNMPVMNGRQMLEHISSNDNLCDIYVAVLTSSGHSNDITECLTSGARKCIEKPLNPTSTKELLASLISTNSPVLSK